MELQTLLGRMLDEKASDMHLKPGRPPLLRIHGTLTALDLPVLSSDDVAGLARELLGASASVDSEVVGETALLDQKNEFDVGYQWEKKARFRANIFRQRGLLSLVLRLIPARIPTLDDLSLPAVIKEIATTERGLVLVTGTTGSGKSTTLAGMVHEINRTKAEHIVTVEDPIEFLHEDLTSSVCQREVGLDTETFASALRYVLRQDPDVILIGEMRDVETVGAALSAAETGHMVFSTLHTADANQTIHRILDFFPENQQELVRQQLSMTLKAVISQRLLVKADGQGRVPAAEIMICTPTIRSLIAENKIGQIRTFMKDGGRIGMQTFDQSLAALFKAGQISREEALSNATSPQELELAMKGITSGRVTVDVAASAMPANLIQQSLERSQGFLKRGMKAEAQAELKKLLLEDPSNAQAKALMKEAEKSDAPADTGAKALVKRGLEAFQQEKIEEALALWKEALDLEPEHPQAKAYLKAAQERQKELAETKNWTDQGVAAYQAGDLTKALAAWEKALKADPRNDKAADYLSAGRKALRQRENDQESRQRLAAAQAALSGGDKLEAAMLASSSLKWSPANKEASELLARVRREIPIETLSEHQAGIEAYVGNEFLKAAVQFNLARQKAPTNQALAGLAERAKQAHTGMLQTLNSKASKAYQEDRLEDALTWWRQAQAADPEDAGTRRALAEAKPAVDQVVAALYSQAVELSQANRLKEAVRLLERLVVLDPSHDAAKRRLEDCRGKLERLKGVFAS
jgi:twitching motility protein PilT